MAVASARARAGYDYLIKLLLIGDSEIGRRRWSFIMSSRAWGTLLMTGSSLPSLLISSGVERLTSLNRELLRRIEMEKDFTDHTRLKYEELTRKQERYVTKIHGAMDRLQEQNNYLHYVIENMKEEEAPMEVDEEDSDDKVID